MYEGTSTEQKAKNAKSGLDSMSKPLLQSLRQCNALQPPFTHRRLHFVCYFIRRVSAHFIDSLAADGSCQLSFYVCQKMNSIDKISKICYIVIGKYYFVKEMGFFYVTNNKKGFGSIFKKSTIKETVKQNNYQ